MRPLNRLVIILPPPLKSYPSDDSPVPSRCKEGGLAALAQARFDPVQTSSCPQYDIAPY